MDEIELLSVNVGRPAVLLRWSGGEVVSGIDKRPVAVPELALDVLNLAGDEQADQRPGPLGGQVHGGPDQAVYAFPAEHYPRVAEIVGSEMWNGYMGENLTIRGATERDVCIGDVWAWGDALLQVTSPRGPCFKLGIRMGKQAMRTAIREEVLTGWYLRVLWTGTVPTSGSITVAERHPDGVTVEQVQRALQDRANTYAELAALDVLAPKLKRLLTIPDRDLSGGVPEVD